MKPVRLRLYDGVNGPVAYDVLGRCWLTHTVGGQIVPVNCPDRAETVDRFAEVKQK